MHLNLFFYSATVVTTAESMSMTFMPERSIYSMLNKRTKRSVDYLKLIIMKNKGKSKFDRKIVQEQSFLN